MKLNKNAETWKHSKQLLTGKEFIDYRYKDNDGDVFSCKASTLEECRSKLHKWLLEKCKQSDC